MSFIIFQHVGWLFNLVDRLALDLSDHTVTVGVLEDDYTCLGIMCAVLFFPLGILFCFALRQRSCPNCGATFG
ncbi:unnamed protein product [Merluccius merluccius]